ncbi:hypothetical protein ACIQUF_24880 [Pseudomonas sp. NPDC090233]|uniref:hypothetical protein n=1 Tax=Pseudomonas sp. NPDC090233 TaxID=3364479 RepID=UPI00383B1593
MDYLVLLKALDNEVELFLADPGNDLPETSSALLDLMDSRTLLREKINSKIDKAR